MVSFSIQTVKLKDLGIVRDLSLGLTMYIFEYTITRFHLTFMSGWIEA